MENWKIYKTTQWNGKDTIYEVSDEGHVKINGVIINLDKDYSHSNYYRFGPGLFVHRAVAELFIPNPDNKPCVDHIDTNTFNNRVSNLRWVTYEENQNNPLTKQHLSESLKGRIIDDVWRINISKGTKEGMSKMSADKKERLKHYGNKYGVGKRTDEQKSNISKGTKEAMNRPEIKAKVSKALKQRKAKWMNNNITSKLVPQVEQQHYIDNGWCFGRI